MKKPSELIRLHLSGGGNGYELDDVMSQRVGGIYDEILKRITSIHEQFRTSMYPIGTSNPDSFVQLEALASELEAQGF